MFAVLVLNELGSAHKDLTGQWTVEMRATKILLHSDKIHAPFATLLSGFLSQKTFFPANLVKEVFKMTTACVVQVVL